MVASFEKNSITLYDRLYLSKDIIQAHLQANNFFIMLTFGYLIIPKSKWI